jgi:hypothetical protein
MKKSFLTALGLALGLAFSAPLFVTTSANAQTTPATPHTKTQRAGQHSGSAAQHKHHKKRKKHTSSSAAPSTTTKKKTTG